MSLTPMVNVDPSDYGKYQNYETDNSTECQQTAPLYTIRVLENESIDITPSSISTQDEGFRSPLIDSSNNIQQMDNIIVCPQSDSVSNLSRKNFFRDEKLQLDCEWDDCIDNFNNISDFTKHVASHVTEAEVRVLDPPHGDVFGCLWTECGFETPSSEEMVRHINFHAFHTKIKCHGLNMLTHHGLAACSLDPGQRNITPEVTDPWLCQWVGCEMAESGFTQPRRFYLHVSEHAEESRVRGKHAKCKWSNCQFQSGTVSKLKEHLRSHTQEKMIGCPNCGALFANRVKFLDHCKRQQVNSEEAYKCNNCGKKFALERLLRDHMRSHINHYKCPHCDMTCVTPSALTSHIRYKHIEEKPFKCTFCDYSGKTQNDLKYHMKIHFEDQELKCPEAGCDYKCKAQASLKKHFMKKHEKATGNNYACHLCDKRYARGAFLTKHLMGEHKFTWPSGHSRFRYIRDEVTGIYRLQTIRFESLELQEELQGGDSLRIADSDIDIDPAESVRSATPSDGGIVFRTSSPVHMDTTPVHTPSVYSTHAWSEGSWSQRASSVRSGEGTEEADRFLTTLLDNNAQNYIVKFPVEM